MTTITYLPLDDRPCNEYFPYLLPITDDVRLKKIPQGVLGNQKNPADFEQVKDFLLNNIEESDYLLISVDTLVYGGLIPSRLHHLDLKTLEDRLNLLKEIKLKKPSLKIYGFLTIMRCANSYFDSEEPTYWTKYGKDIFSYGKAKHCEPDKLKDFDIPEEVIKDFVTRRKTNLELTKKCLLLVKEGMFDFFALPQDDSHKIGWTKMDQIELTNFIDQNKVEPRPQIYPGADEVGMAMLARILGDIKHIKTKVFVKYLPESDAFVIPPYEDRETDKTIEAQIFINGCQRVKNIDDADVILAVHSEHSNEVNLVSEVKPYASKVGFADIKDPSVSDEKLIKEIQKQIGLFSIGGYAGWNTCSNIVGTVLANLVTKHISKDDRKNKRFLAHRYIDDYGYCTKTRGWVDVNAALARGYCEAELDGFRGTCTIMCKEHLVELLKNEMPEVLEIVNDFDVSSPWNRSFEMKFELME